LGVNWCGKE